MSRKTRKPIGRDEYNQLMNYFQNEFEGRNYTSVTYQRITTLLFFTGLRINETQEILKKDITSAFDDKELVVYVSKQDKYRSIPLTNDALKQLQELYFFGEPSTTVWCGKGRERKSTYSNINLIQQYNQQLKKVLGKRYTSHSFRQGVITDMLREGVDLTVTQTFIGHKNSSQTASYYRPTVDEIRGKLVR